MRRRPMSNLNSYYMITRDGRDTAIDRLTAENYIVPKGEERCYHCVIEVKQFDPRTGERLSRPRVQKFGRKTFDTSVRDSLAKQGYTVTVLHDPNEWLEAHRAELAAKAKADREARERAEQERFDAAVAAAVEKAMAENARKSSKKQKEV